MPELPEVETIRLGLQKCVLYKKIAVVDLKRQGVVQGDYKSFLAAVAGSSFKRIDRLLVN